MASHALQCPILAGIYLGFDLGRGGAGEFRGESSPQIEPCLSTVVTVVKIIIVKNYLIDKECN